MSEPISQKTPNDERKPGRSFDDPSKALGDGILERSTRSNVVPEDFQAREVQTATPHNGVAERAKAISVLRKFEELVADDNPPVHDETKLQCVLDLACGRVGLTRKEYDGLVQGDEELVPLEANVLFVARSKF